MPALASDLRRQLEAVIIQAREVAEAAARSKLTNFGVAATEAFSDRDRELRNRLRARGRQVGDVRLANGTQSIDQLTQELAYEFWHRMLFARFLAENDLLIHPDDGVSVTLEECEGDAPNATPPAPNGFVLAARYASKMLPLIFRTDDVLLEIEFAPEQRLALEKLLASLPTQTFLADDSLGWVYQFWQSKKKDEVNKSGDKIDGRTLPAVTQLFTEPYMVQFLLHNTIGAWWCARHGVQGPSGGAGVPAGQSPVEMEYLRWRDDGTPAAGQFEGWPKTLAEFTMLDPCCGSGHFLVAAFNLLVPLRMNDEKLSAKDACDAVLKENLHGLELDPRCTQIAAFALAMAAWKYPDEDGQPLGYRPLPPLNIACCGQEAVGKREDWEKLGGDTWGHGWAVATLYQLFQKASHLGSLIDTCIFRNDPLFRESFVDVRTTLASLFRPEHRDSDAAAMAVAAQGIATAADILTRTYTLLATNVPYLGRGKQAPVIAKHLEGYYPLGKADLATAFVLRCLELCAVGGSTAIVTPQNWLFLTSYKKLREELLKRRRWNFVVSLGEEAWCSFGIRGPRTVLLGLTVSVPDGDGTFFGIDVSTNRGEPIIPLEEKIERLADRLPTPVQVVEQAGQLRNPDAAVSLGSPNQGGLLGSYAHCYQGISTEDNPRFVFFHWEASSGDIFRRMQSPPNVTTHFGGRECVLRSALFEADCDQGTIRGEMAWGKQGVALSETGLLSCTRFGGQPFPNTTHVVIPDQVDYLLPIWCYAESGELVANLRSSNTKLGVGNGYVTKVPFDLAHWQAVAAEKYPNGLPEPYSDDPTQWLFKGDIPTSTDPLQVAVARLVGYHWPDQPPADAVVDPFVDDDGIVCLPGVRHEAPAAERLADLFRAVGYKTEVDLTTWLRDKFFEEHCKRFHQRPFVWHIWDGRKDGFAALVNYHKLTHKSLENLTYSYLGDWIKAQADDARVEKTGAGDRLAAAQKLQEQFKLILSGEPPHDLFVRWKPLHEQAIGWNPDLNDGVRMNIRPFVKADILRKTPNIKWGKDRGKEPQRDKDDYPWFWSGTTVTGDRVNDVHLTNDEKQAARTRKGAK